MKSKKITIWSTKGGVGKTSICAELHFRLGWPVVTNEEDSMLSTIINSDKLKILKPKEKIQDYDNNILFDFGGYFDNRIIDALEQSTFIVIPVVPNAIDIQGTINSINNVREYNKNIIVVVNRIKDINEYIHVQHILFKLGQFKYFGLNETKALPNIFKKKKSISQMTSNALLKYVYRKIISQLEDIVLYINS